jgi:hypothetical protein
MQTADIFRTPAIGGRDSPRRTETGERIHSFHIDGMM